MTANHLTTWRPRWASGRLLWLAAAVAAALLLASIAWTARRRPTLHVTTAAVSAGSIVRTILATGTLQAITTVQVGAQVSGTIASLFADYNSIVHAHQAIATLDPALLDAQLQQARAALGQANANLAGDKTAVEDARMKLVRAEELGARQLIPQSDLDAARIAMDQANADLRAGESQLADAQAAVDQARVNVDHTTIYSPIDGIVVARNVDVGQTVASAFQAPVLFQIAADLSRMQVEVDIDEADIGGVTPGETATFQVEAYPNDTFTGTVSTVRLQPIAEQTTTATAAGTGSATPTTTTVATVVSYATMIDVGNPDGRLRPGMTATVVLAGLRRDHAVRIPNNALSFRPPPEVLQAIGQTVDRIASDARSPDDGPARQVWEYDGAAFRPIAVRTGIGNRDWTELLSGSLRPGDALVTSASLPSGR